MIDLEQLRKDMEAGTDGPWDAGWTTHGLTGPSTAKALGAFDRGAFPVAFKDNHYFGCLAAVTTSTADIDARRIARLPDLERAYLELREAADAMADAIDTIEAVEDGADLDAAYRDLIEKLLAYRKATQ